MAPLPDDDDEELTPVDERKEVQAIMQDMMREVLLCTQGPVEACLDELVTAVIVRVSPSPPPASTAVPKKGKSKKGRSRLVLPSTPTTLPPVLLPVEDLEPVTLVENIDPEAAFEALVEAAGIDDGELRPPTTATDEVARDDEAFDQLLSQMGDADDADSDASAPPDMPAAADVNDTDSDASGEETRPGEVAS